MTWHVAVLYGNEVKDAVIDARSPAEAIAKFYETLPDEIREKVRDVMCSLRRRPPLTLVPNEPAAIAVQ